MKHTRTETVPERFAIWREGYLTSPEPDYGTAELMGYASGVDLRDACARLAAFDARFAIYYQDRESGPNWWGCRLYDNEHDARAFERAVRCPRRRIDEDNRRAEQCIVPDVDAGRARVG